MAGVMLVDIWTEVVVDGMLVLVGAIALVSHQLFCVHLQKAGVMLVNSWTEVVDDGMLVLLGAMVLVGVQAKL